MMKQYKDNSVVFQMQVNSPEEWKEKQGRSDRKNKRLARKQLVEAL